MKNITAILLIILSALIFYMFIGPTYSVIQSRLADKAQYDQALNNSKKILDLRDQLLSKYNGFLPNDRARLEKFLPDQVNNIRLLIEVDSRARQYGLSLKDVSLGTKNAAKSSVDSQNIDLTASPFNTVTLGFSVTGNYNSFLSFLKDLEKSLRVLDVTSIDFTPPADKPNDPYDFKVSLNTYSYINPQQ